MSDAKSLIVLDFETTGLSPDMGDRAIEIGAVRIEAGVVTDRFQALMNPGRKVDAFIENYTGISNEMLKDAESCAVVMNQFADFIGDSHLLAHNASFDKRFLDAEFKRIKRTYEGEFVCSLLIARRVLQGAPNHKLGTLVNYCKIESEGQFHRALFDSEMTALLWLNMIEHIESTYSLPKVSIALIKKITKTAKKSVSAMLSKERDKIEANKAVN